MKRESREWRKGHRDVSRRWDLRTKYGIGLEEYDQMVADQGGVCSICGLKKSRPLAVDHDHKTGVVRGLLCASCNGVLGFIENPEWMEKAIDYLKRIGVAA